MKMEDQVLLLAQTNRPLWMALQQSVEFVQSMYLAFLRREQYNVDKAASCLARHFERDEFGLREGTWPKTNGHAIFVDSMRATVMVGRNGQQKNNGRKGRTQSTTTTATLSDLSIDRHVLSCQHG